MQKHLKETFEQLELDGVNQSGSLEDSNSQEVPVKITDTLRHFLPGVEVSFDSETDEIVLR